MLSFTKQLNVTSFMCILYYTMLYAEYWKYCRKVHPYSEQNPGQVLILLWQTAKNWPKTLFHCFFCRTVGQKLKYLIVWHIRRKMTFSTASPIFIKCTFEGTFIQAKAKPVFVRSRCLCYHSSISGLKWMERASDRASSCECSACGVMQRTRLTSRQV